MFSFNVYQKRRNELIQRVPSGLILLLGNEESPMNYPANPYPFRQDSSFLYYFGVDNPGFAGLIDIDENKSMLVGNDFSVDDIVWMGPQPLVSDYEKMSGADLSMNHGRLSSLIQDALKKGRTVHFLPPYRMENAISLSKLLGIQTDNIKSRASVDLIRAVVSQREVKSQDEVAEIEKALEISWDMVQEMLNRAKPGIGEFEIVGALTAILEAKKSRFSFPIILSIHGETLHNHHHNNILRHGDLLVCDSGAESPLHYASDITRTFPVGGRFSSRQRDVYETVLAAQKNAVELLTPGTPFRDAHLTAAKTIFMGMKDIGLMKGNADDAVNEGAHALFFPHGLGHMMGLDVHDMEDLGENYVGYDDTCSRSEQFGLAYLRMAKPIQPGHVITVEPGIYFIPELIDLWEKEKKHASFINYEKISEYRNFGGIRIEDDIVVSENGVRVLGRPIPKEVDEIESIMSRNL